AHGPAALPVGEAAVDPGRVVDGKVVEAPLGPAALGVDHRAIPGEAELADDRCDLIKLERARAVRIDEAGIGLLQIHAGPRALDAQHHVAPLILAADLTAGDPGARVVREVLDEQAVIERVVGLHPHAACVAAEVTAAPGIHRHG